MTAKGSKEPGNINNWTKEGLPVVSVDTLVAITHDATTRSQEYLPEFYERIKKENPVVYHAIIAALDTFSETDKPNFLTNVFTIYHCLERQAESNKMAGYKSG
jgi:hypothetical protein